MLARMKENSPICASPQPITKAVLNGYLKLINNKWNVMGNHVGEHKKNYKNKK